MGHLKNFPQSFFFFLTFHGFRFVIFVVVVLWLYYVARGILVPQPGIEPASPVVEAQIPHRFLTIGLPGKYLSLILIKQFP